jgi:hypothetical protein
MTANAKTKRLFTSFESSFSRVVGGSLTGRPDFFADDAAERVFNLGRLAFNELAQGIVDQGLIPGRPAGLVGLFEEIVQQFLVETDGDARLSLRFRRRRHNPAALAFTEIGHTFIVCTRCAYWRRRIGWQPCNFGGIPWPPARGGRPGSAGVGPGGQNQYLSDFAFGFVFDYFIEGIELLLNQSQAGDIILGRLRAGLENAQDGRE